MSVRITLLFALATMITACGGNALPPDDVTSLPAIDGPCTPHFYESQSGGSSDLFASDSITYARVYYPECPGQEEVSYSAVTLTGGWPITPGGREFRWLAKRLTSHGFIVILFTANSYGINTSTHAFGDGHHGALATLLVENNRYESPIYGKVKEDSLGVIGASRGGQGAVHVAESDISNIRAAVAIEPWKDLYATTQHPNVNVPIFFMTGSLDFLAPPAWVRSAFESVPGTKIYANFTGISHFDIPIGGRNHGMYSKYIVAFLKVYLDGDKSFNKYLSGSEHSMDCQNGYFSEYIMVPPVGGLDC